MHPWCSGVHGAEYSYNVKFMTCMVFFIGLPEPSRWLHKAAKYGGRNQEAGMKYFHDCMTLKKCSFAVIFIL